MSKKILTHKKAQIRLEPDGFSIHTFELSMQFGKAEWDNCKEQLYADQKNPTKPGSTRTNPAKVCTSARNMQIPVFASVWNTLAAKRNTRSISSVSSSILVS